jgi:hypothetical protein
MELTYVTIVVLASMIFVLSGMVGYLYWQQTRMLQHLQSLAMVVANQVSEMQEQVENAEEEVEVEEEEIPSEPEKGGDEHAEPDVPPVEEEEEDDRLSVEEVEGPVSKDTPPDLDIDDLATKTVVQLRELLTQRGIPFGKRDSKTILLQLLKATA